MKNNTENISKTLFKNAYKIIVFFTYKYTHTHTQNISLIFQVFRFKLKHSCSASHLISSPSQMGIAA